MPAHGKANALRASYIRRDRQQKFARNPHFKRDTRPRMLKTSCALFSYLTSLVTKSQDMSWRSPNVAFVEGPTEAEGAQAGAHRDEEAQGSGKAVAGAPGSDGRLPGAQHGRGLRRAHREREVEEATPDAPGGRPAPGAPRRVRQARQEEPRAGRSEPREHRARGDRGVPATPTHVMPRWREPKRGAGSPTSHSLTNGIHP